MSASYGELLVESFRRRYDAGRDSWTTEDAMARPARLLLSGLPPDGPHHVLDVGAGRGRDVELFLRAGHRATGVDLIAVPEWRRLETAFSGRVSFFQTPFLSFKPQERFAALLDNGCFHHQHPDEYEPYLAHARTLLLPRGRALLSVCTPSDPRTASETHVGPDGRLSREFTIAELAPEVGRAGFTVLRSTRLYRRAMDRYYLAALVERRD